MAEQTDPQPATEPPTGGSGGSPGGSEGAGGTTPPPEPSQPVRTAASDSDRWDEFDKRLTALEGAKDAEQQREHDRVESPPPDPKPESARKPWHRR